MIFLVKKFEDQFDDLDAPPNENCKQYTEFKNVLMGTVKPSQVQKTPAKFLLLSYQLGI